MNPLVDEKLLLTVSAAFSDVCADLLGISAVREAYGSTAMEGICFESCARTDLSGDLNGSVFFCCDGYSRLLLLPYIAAAMHVGDLHPEVVESIMLMFYKQVTEKVTYELYDFLDSVKLSDPQSMNFRLLPLPGSDYRKYMAVFFMRDVNARRYLGRMNVFISLRKLPDQSD